MKEKFKNTSDVQLMLNFKEGDISSFEELIKRYKKSVINIIYRFLGDRDEAENLALEVFLRVYKSVKRYRARAKFTTWLYKIAVNLSLSELKKKRKHFSISLNTPIIKDKGGFRELIDDVADPSPPPEKILEEKERNFLIKKAISLLPPGQRMAVILRIYEELSYKEISKILDCSVKSVESKLYRARTNLKKKLQSYFEIES